MKDGTTHFIFTCQKCGQHLRCKEKDFIEIRCPLCKSTYGIHSFTCKTLLPEKINRAQNE